jgi:fumarylpyruvate hydrolase
MKLANGAQLLFPADPAPVVPITGESRGYPVHRIFCVGRNYADHAREMGFEVDREAPWYFTKPANAVVLSGATIAYPPETSDYHYEMELVVAIGAPAFRVPATDADKAIYGYACGLDMTRRDLQIAAREKSRPWDLGKAFEDSAVISAITPAKRYAAIGLQTISLKAGNVIKQNAHLSDLIWTVPELVSHLSRFYHLRPGDLIYSGTPAGVGPVGPGDHLIGQIDGLESVVVIIGDPA